jgi:hypothetical protein
VIAADPSHARMRHIFIPELHIDMLKQRSRNFR